MYANVCGDKRVSEAGHFFSTWSFIVCTRHTPKNPLLYLPQQVCLWGKFITPLLIDLGLLEEIRKAGDFLCDLLWP